jgi:hypothetical protein
MPAIQTLNPEQMGEIITYMQSKWNHPVTDLTVKKWLDNCQ